MTTQTHGYSKPETLASLATLVAEARTMQAHEMRHTLGSVGSALKSACYAAAKKVARVTMAMAEAAQARGQHIKRSELFYE